MKYKYKEKINIYNRVCGYSSVGNIEDKAKFIYINVKS